MALDIRRDISAIAGSGHRWSGFEQLTGWAIMGLPFESGHVLGLRDFGVSDFAPYRSIWHRDPAGNWSVHVDGPALEVGCPRWWGPALHEATLASIRIECVDARTLRVSMAEPALDWTITLERRPMEGLMNLASAPMPTWSWRPRALRAMREVMGRGLLGLGRITMSEEAPAGVEAVLMPKVMYGVESSHATLGGLDLGGAVTAAAEPEIGRFRLPRRGVLAIGDFRARIADQGEYAALVARYGNGVRQAG
jgi:hypothetical protein